MHYVINYIHICWLLLRKLWWKYFSSKRTQDIWI